MLLAHSQVKEIPAYDLSEVFTKKVPYQGQVLLVDSYTGAASTCYFQFGPEEVLTRQEIINHKAWGWGEDREIWIVNTAAQAGKTLKISIGGAGASLSAGTSATGDATEAKQDSIITVLGTLEDKFENQGSLAFGQTTVGTSEVVLAASQAVPHGFAVVVKALGANTGKVHVGLTGVLITTGFELSAGASVSVYVANLNLIYCIADTAAQKVSYIVEKAS